MPHSRPGARRLPRALVEKARAFAGGREAPVEPRNAASVILCRDRRVRSEGALELFWLQRQGSMAFAAGMAVFPGGSVEDSDFAELPDSLWRGPSPTEWAARLGVEVPLARALVCAAVRETFEECGVLLAERVGGPDLAASDREQARRSLVESGGGLAEMLVDGGLALRTDLLTPWGCWVTPIFQPRRYRTWFFLAVEPPGQSAEHVSTEALESLWATPEEALRGEDSTEWSMMPPQYTTCVELYGVPDYAAARALARRRELDPILPTARFLGDEAHLEIPEPLMLLTDQVRAEMGLP